MCLSWTSWLSREGSICVSARARQKCCGVNNALTVAQSSAQATDNILSARLHKPGMLCVCRRDTVTSNGQSVFARHRLYLYLHLGLWLSQWLHVRCWRPVLVSVWNRAEVCIDVVLPLFTLCLIFCIVFVSLSRSFQPKHFQCCCMSAERHESEVKLSRNAHS